MVTVVVPWRGGCPHRERAWQWVRAQYALKHPDWHVVEAVAPDGPWCKAAAVMPAVEAAEDGVVVVADADVFVARTLGAAVAAVETGLARWSIPHFKVYRLDEAGTGLLVRGESGFADSLDQPPYRGLMGGGVVIARRETLLDAPLDVRFVGWGQEDASWNVALNTLHAFPWRGDGPLWHLWHPPQGRMNRKVGSVASHQLHRRYLGARRDPVAMRALIEEARHVSRESAQYAGHGHASSGERVD